MTPEEEKALLDELLGMGSDAPRQQDISAPVMAPLPTPDVEGAEVAARTAIRETRSLRDPVNAPIEAEQMVDELLARPEPIKPKPTLTEQAAISYSPKRASRDERPDAPTEGFRESVSAWVGEKGPLEVVGQLAQPGSELGRYAYQFGQGAAERLMGGDPTAPLLAEGSRTENAAMYLLRTLFTTAPAIITETVERAPAMDLAGGIDAARKAPDNVSALTAFMEEFYGEPSTVGEQLLGVKPGELQKIRRTDEGIGRDWAQGVLERIERGGGLEEDFSLAASRRLGPEYAGVGWVAGLGADALLNWEKGLVAAPKALARTATTAKRLADVTPEGMGSVAKYLEAAIKGHEISYTSEIAGRLADDIEAGRRTIEDLPPEWRLRLDEAALVNNGVSARELLGVPGSLTAARKAELTEYLRKTETDPGRVDAAIAAQNQRKRQELAERLARGEAEPVREPGAAPEFEGEELRREMADYLSRTATDPERVTTAIAAREHAQASERLEHARAMMARLERGEPEPPDGAVPEALPPNPNLRAELAEYLAKTERSASRVPGTTGPATQARQELIGRFERGEPEPPAPPGKGPEKQELSGEALRAELAEYLRKTAPRTISEFPVRTYDEFLTFAKRYKDGDIPPGEGFRRMLRDAPGEVVANPQRAEYIIRDADGERIGELRSGIDAVLEMQKRSRIGDQIWQGNRPVAVWREADGAVVPHPWFAGPIEVKWLETIKPTGKALSAPPASAPAQQMGSELLQKLAGAPPRERNLTHYDYEVEPRHQRDPEAELEEMRQSGQTQYWRVGLVPVDDVLTPRTTQPDKLRGVEAAMKSGTKLPPIEAGRTKDGAIELSDGHHRLLAAKRLGYTHVPARELVVVDKYGTTPLDKESIFPSIREGRSDAAAAVPVDVLERAAAADLAELDQKIGTLTARIEASRKNRKVRVEAERALAVLQQKRAQLADAIQTRRVQSRAVAAAGEQPPPPVPTPTRATAEPTAAPVPPPPAPAVQMPPLPARLPPPPRRPPPAPEPPIRIPEQPRTRVETISKMPRDFFDPSPKVPASPRPPSVKPSTTLRDLMGVAGRSIGADSMFTDRLAMLSNTALVPKTERIRIEQEAQDAIGLTAEEARSIISGKREIPSAVLQKMRQFVPDAGPTLDAQTYMAAKNAALSSVSRGMADVRYRVRGLRPLRERFIVAMSDGHIKRGAPKLISSWQQKGPFRWLHERFSSDVLARLPDGPRQVWQQVKTKWDRAADELSAEIRKTGGRNVISRIIESYRPAVPAELHSADDILLGRELSSVMQRDALDVAYRSDPNVKRLVDERADEVDIAAAAKRWAQGRVAVAADHGRDFIRAALSASGKQAALSIVDDIEDSAAREVFSEVARGLLTGPATMEQLGKFGVRQLDENETSLYYALQLYSRALLADAGRELLGSRAAITADDPRMPVLSAVLSGTHASKQGGRLVYRYPDADVTWALGQLRDWGLEPGAGTTLSRTKVGDNNLVAPDFLVEEVESLKRAGVLDSRELTPFKAYNAIMRLYKESLTHGIVAPNPAHILGQVVGMMPTLWTSRGLSGLASTAHTGLWRYPRQVKSLVNRLGGYGIPITRGRTADDEVLKVGNSLYSMSDLEQTARAAGLHETRADFETAQQLSDLISTSERGWFDGRNLKKGYDWWQEVLRKFAGAADLNARMASYVDLVAKGVPPAQAAEEAKRATLDFSAMTPFEKRQMRAAVTFYAFMRKNADAYVRAAILHPERLGQQGRAAHASLESSGYTDLELSNMSDRDMARLSVNDSDEVIDRHGRVHPLYRGNRLTTPPGGIIEFMGLLQMIAPWKGPDGIFGTGFRELLGSASPLIQALAVEMQGRKLESTFQTPETNMVPPVLLEGPWGPFVMDYFGVGPEPLTPKDDPLLAQEGASDILNAPARYTAGGKYLLEGKTDKAVAARKRWQRFMVWLARPVSQLQTIAEAAGYAEPPPYMTQSHSTVSALTGLRYRPVVRDEEVLRKRGEEQVERLNKAAKDARLPQGVGPR